MIHEATISYVKIDEKGNDKQVKEKFIVDGCETFTEVEDKMFGQFGGYTALDVTAIKRSRLSEIANQRTLDADKIFIADVCDTFTDDNGVEKEIKYSVALFAETIDGAHNFMREFLNQGYSMQLVSLKETKFVDLIN